jgi:SHS2 domain-containing protein
MKTFEYLDHPSDLKIRSIGQNLAELFIHSAEGMMNFLYGPVKKNDTPLHNYSIELLNLNVESLLVNWLSEILYLSDTHHCRIMYYHFKECNEHTLIADVQAQMTKAKKDIKAVTYNELEVKKTNDLWAATVVYDL